MENRVKKHKEQNRTNNKNKEKKHKENKIEKGKNFDEKYSWICLNLVSHYENIPI